MPAIVPLVIASSALLNAPAPAVFSVYVTACLLTSRMRCAMPPLRYALLVSVIAASMLFWICSGVHGSAPAQAAVCAAGVQKTITSISLPVSVGASPAARSATNGAAPLTIRGSPSGGSRCSVTLAMLTVPSACGRIEYELPGKVTLPVIILPFCTSTAEPSSASARRAMIAMPPPGVRSTRMTCASSARLSNRSSVNQGPSDWSLVFAARSGMTVKSGATTRSRTAAGLAIAVAADFAGTAAPNSRGRSAAVAEMERTAMAAAQASP